MPTAFTLVNIELGKDQEVLKGLKAINGVTEAYVCYGIYDIIAKIETKTDEELKNIINREIVTIENVRSTLTIITI